MDHQLVIKYRFIASMEIEVGMLRQIEDGRLVCRRAIVKGKCIIITQHIQNLHFQITRISFITIRTHMRESNTNTLFSFYFFCRPNSMTKTLDTSMQMMRRQVLRKHIFLSLK